MYTIVESSAQKQGSKTPYRHIAIIETVDGYIPSRIDTRPKGVVRIAWIKRELHLGFHPRGNTATERARREAKAMLAELQS
jgi:hypothetical protein